jgi:SAM-dependent methyltransferase
MYSREALATIFSELDQFVGWDFSRVRDRRGQMPWDYGDIARDLARNRTMLDLGTGGAEVLRPIAAQAESVVAVDVSISMLLAAQRNLSEMHQGKISLLCGDSMALSFIDSSFDLVCNRHAPYSISEIARVLRPGGIFITQQVGNRNTENLLRCFGWNASSYGPNYWGPTLTEAAKAAAKEGLKVTRQEECDVEYWFLDIESLLIWLHAVPLPEPFDIERHWPGVRRIVEEHSTEHGIKTNEHRTFLFCENAL